MAATQSVSIRPGGAHTVTRAIVSQFPAGVSFTALPTYPAASGMNDTSYWPTGAWLCPMEDASERTADEACGVNLYVGLWTNGSLSIATANGAKVLVQWSTTDGFPTPTAEWANLTTTGATGWVLYDELDMFGGTQSANETYLGNVSSTLNGRGDARIRYLNWGKGVLFWNSDSEAGAYINNWGDVTSADAYWYTDPNISGAGEGGALLNGGNALTDAQTRLACNYARVMDEMVRLDSLSGSPRKPLWQFIEAGRPWGETVAQNSPTMTGDHMRGAAWQSVIAGAQGIVWFVHSFSADGSYGMSDGRIFREGNYTEQRAAAAEINGRLHTLSPVLHSDTASGYVTASANLRTLTKYYQGYWYIFAGSLDGTTGSRTITIVSGGASSSTVEVLYESRSLTLSGNQFTDTFASEWSTHIYRIAA